MFCFFSNFILNNTSWRLLIELSNANFDYETVLIDYPLLVLFTYCMCSICFYFHPFVNYPFRANDSAITKHILLALTRKSQQLGCGFNNVTIIYSSSIVDEMLTQWGYCSLALSHLYFNKAMLCCGRLFLWHIEMDAHRGLQACVTLKRPVAPLTNMV